MGQQMFSGSSEINNTEENQLVPDNDLKDKEFNSTEPQENKVIPGVTIKEGTYYNNANILIGKHIDVARTFLKNTEVYHNGRKVDYIKLYDTYGDPIDPFQDPDFTIKVVTSRFGNIESICK